MERINLLKKWFSTVTVQDLSVSGPMVKIQGEEFAKKLNHSGFKATDDWLADYKSRKQTQFEKAHGE